MPVPGQSSPGTRAYASAVYTPSMYTASAYTTRGLPDVALRAYRHAAELLGRSDPTCHLHWSVLAAIGRVESNHGRYGGSTLQRSGQVQPPILGLVLDGTGATARIADTDGGRFDNNARFDRAVGPMQFLPGTWNFVGVDGNGDGQADPSNVFDAALSAGRYLCAGDIDLSQRQQLREAIYSYNHSMDYVALVLHIAAAYRSGTPVTSVPPVPDDVQAPEPFEPRTGTEVPPATSGKPPAAAPKPGGNTPGKQQSGKQQSGKQRSDDGQDPLARTKGTPPGSSPPTAGHPSPPASDNPSATPEHPTSSPEHPTSSPKDPTTPPHDPTTPPQNPTPSPKNPTTPPPDPTTPTTSPTSPSPSPKDPPAVSAMNPMSGTVGSQVTIEGTGLDEARITVDGAKAGKDTAASSEDELVVEMPAHAEAGSATLTVHGPDGKVLERGTYTYVPTVSTISPQEGSARGGDTVDITGRSLHGAVAYFGDAEAETVSDSGTELTVRTPEGKAETVHVTVRSNGQQTSETADFTYRPEVTAVTPDSPTTGDTVRLQGAGFSDASTVTLVAEKTGDEISITRGVERPQPDTLRVSLPEKPQSGQYTLVVSTNGVTSAPVTIEVTDPDG